MRTLADIGEDALIARLVSLAPTGNAGEGPGMIVRWWMKAGKCCGC
jgi:hypothetical protein